VGEGEWNHEGHPGCLEEFDPLFHTCQQRKVLAWMKYLRRVRGKCDDAWKQVPFRSPLLQGLDERKVPLVHAVEDSEGEQCRRVGRVAGKFLR
jgi:hypothetical protein